MNKNAANSVYIQPISFKKLSYILDQTPLNIFLDIIQCDSGFLETMNRSSNSTEMILLTIKVLLKFVETPFTEHIAVFLKKIAKKNNYWKQIEQMLKETTKKQPPSTVNTKQKKKNNKVILHRNDYELWEQIYALSVAIGKRIDLPSDFLKCISDIIDANKNENLNLVQLKIAFQLLIKTEPKSNEINEAVSDNDNHDATNESDNEVQHQTYYSMEIYPTIDELKEKQNDYVKANIIKGRFNSVDHYLYVQLALLREDFISPLRDGIVKIIQQTETDPNAKPKSNINVRVYPNVRILIKQRENFNKSNFKSEYLMVDLEAKTRSEPNSSDTNNNIKYSKKLMYGSLLCFTTSTKFDDLLIAVVSNRDVDLLNQGYVSISTCEKSKILVFILFIVSLNISNFSVFVFRFKSK